MSKDNPTVTTTFGGLIYEFDFDEISKDLAEQINRSAVKFDKASGSRFLSEEVAAAIIKDYLVSNLLYRLDTEIRCQQTKEIMACQTPKQ